jgi:hypothetical protein
MEEKKSDNIKLHISFKITTTRRKQILMIRITVLAEKYLTN